MMLAGQMAKNKPRRTQRARRRGSGRMRRFILEFLLRVLRVLRVLRGKKYDRIERIATKHTKRHENNWIFILVPFRVFRGQDLEGNLALNSRGQLLPWYPGGLEARQWSRARIIGGMRDNARSFIFTTAASGSVDAVGEAGRDS